MDLWKQTLQVTADDLFITLKTHRELFTSNDWCWAWTRQTTGHMLVSCSTCKTRLLWPIMDFIKDSSNSSAHESSDSPTYEWMKRPKGTLSLWGSLAFPSAPLMADIRDPSLQWACSGAGCCWDDTGKRRAKCTVTCSNLILISCLLFAKDQTNMDTL